MTAGIAWRTQSDSDKNLCMIAAYLLSDPKHVGRPFEDAIFRGLFQAGCERIDLYVPNPQTEPHGYTGPVELRPIEYRFSWLRRRIKAKQWREYALFLGACDLPMAFAGALALRARRPVITCCDEIYTGRQSGVVGYWRTLAKFAMRRSAATIITDRVRCALQSEYAGLSSRHRFVENPCCFTCPYDGPSKSELRAKFGIPQDAFVVALTGQPHDCSGAPELIRLMRPQPPDLGFLVQTAGLEARTIDAFFRFCAGIQPLYYFPERVSYLRALQITNAADVGLVIYRQQAPQFRCMGMSSQKLCNHLLLGQPVISLRQPSFDFVEDFKCGIQVDSEEDILPALERIRADYALYSTNARRCVAEHLRPTDRVEHLASEFRAIVDPVECTR